jgi:hypothetical protein
MTVRDDLVLPLDVDSMLLDNDRVQDTCGTTATRIWRHEQRPVLGDIRSAAHRVGYDDYLAHCNATGSAP